MPRKADDLQKHTLNLRAGDFERLGEMYPDLGASVAVRKIVSHVIDKHARETAAKINPADLQLD